MKTTRTNNSCTDKFLDIEIVKMKMELLQFVEKMQSEGYLKTVDYEQLTSRLTSKEEEWNL
ncbi:MULTISPECIES: hypothetical protein [Sporosarcina]|uniref:Fur-regulated basic protein A n=1 Tax=Sporosarcina contaminans TaxID=633403 RepID=A0ABW3TWA2_9BACL